MNKRFKTKTLIAICSLAVVFGLICTASFFAIFANRQKTENSITTGTIQVDLQEEFRPGGGNQPPVDPDDPNSPVTNPDDPNHPDYNGFGAEDAVKIIKGYNSGTQPAYVRVRLFPVVETLVDEFAKEWAVHGGIPSNRIVYNLESSGWVYNEADDFYYYSKILQPGETTTELVVSELTAELNEAEMML